MSALDHVIANITLPIIEKTWFAQEHSHSIEVNQYGYISLSMRDNKVIGFLYVRISNTNYTTKYLEGTLSEKSSKNRIDKIVGEWIEQSKTIIEEMVVKENKKLANIEQSKVIMKKYQSAFGGVIHERQGHLHLSDGLMFIKMEMESCQIVSYDVTNMNDLADKLIQG